MCISASHALFDASFSSSWAKTLSLDDTHVPFRESSELNDVCARARLTRCYDSSPLSMAPRPSLRVFRFNCRDATTTFVIIFIILFEIQHLSFRAPLSTLARFPFFFFSFLLFRFSTRMTTEVEVWCPLSLFPF